MICYREQQAAPDEKMWYIPDVSAHGSAPQVLLARVVQISGIGTVALFWRFFCNSPASPPQCRHESQIGPISCPVRMHAWYE